MKALLLENIQSNAVDLLRSQGVEVEARKGGLDPGELTEALAGVDMLGIRSKARVTREVLEAHPDLQAVGAFCIGTNQIDLAAATDAATVVFNAPYSNTRSVVELAMAEIISMARRLTDRNKALHEGVWDKTAEGSHEVRGRTLGIVGYGNIGKQLSVLAEAFGMDVHYYDIVDRLAIGNATKCDSLEELLNRVETVTLHVDGRASNKDMFGREMFRAMRPRSLFLNLSRGHVVDHEALREALVSGHLAGAAVDVFPSEPKTSGSPFVSPLQNLPNVILTPHVGGSTAEAQENIGTFVAGKLMDYSNYGSTSLSVNFPEVQLDPVAQGTRLLHIHENLPGVLATVNSVLGENGINVDRQQLVTKGHMGYLVTDCGNGVTPETVEAIRALPETIRVTTVD